jgi:1-acyl-sn-glycerol-3-phosphate acyltransferase
VYQGREFLALARLPLSPLVHPDPRHPPRLYRFALWLVRLALRILVRVQVVGAENVPEPPFIIAANHTAWFDPMVIIPAFRTVPIVYTMARRDTVFNRRWKRWLVPRFGVFPVQPRQGQLDQGAVATVYGLLARGAVVLIFPEGAYSHGRELRPLKSGVAHFALQAGVPICPVAISGVERLRPFARITVSIGPPVWPDPPRWWDLNRRVNRLLESVRRAIMHSFDRRDRARGTERRRRWLGWPWWRPRRRLRGDRDGRAALGPGAGGPAGRGAAAEPPGRDRPGGAEDPRRLPARPGRSRPPGPAG